MIQKGSAVGRSIIRVGVLMCAVGLMVAPTAVPAHAYSETVYGHFNDIPWMQYNKNPSSPLNSKLTAWMSVNGARYRIEMRAGSGDGSKNDCATNHGWLPNGFYDQDGNDGDNFAYYYKDWGISVVRGWVWELGNKRCSSGSVTRTELFIHSQGYSGWSNSNYSSAGCVKINQTDRSHLRNRYRLAYKRAGGFLQVIS